MINLKNKEGYYGPGPEDTITLPNDEPEPAPPECEPDPEEVDAGSHWAMD